MGAGQFLLLFVITPLVWAAAVGATRRGLMAFGIYSDRAEKLFLGVMLSPLVIGVLIWSVPGYFPAVELPLPDLAINGEGGEAAQAGANTSLNEQVRFWSPALQSLCVLYSVIAGVALVRAASGYVRAITISRAATPFDGDRLIRITEERISPFAVPGGGVVLPKAFVAEASAEEVGFVVDHERAHVRRHDPLWFIALAAIDAVFWINPSIRQQTKACRLSAELACDRAASGGAPEMRKAYAATLIRVLKHAAGNAPTCAPAVVSPGTQGDYQVRISNIMKPESVRRNRHSGLTIGALALALVPVAVAQGALAGAASPDFTVRPVEGKLTSSYGPRPHPVTREPAIHHGTDIAAPMGTPIYAPASGKVVRIMNSDEGYGNMLELDHGDGVLTRYAQLQKVEVEGRATVRAGDLIARVGSSGRSTGPHLHVEVFVDGKRVDPATVLDLPGREAPHAH